MGERDYSGYDRDIRLERRFDKTVKAILGNYFIGQDPQHDRQSGTDFEIFTVRPFKVAARLRTWLYYRHYPNEFTIRWQRPSGIKTEIDKIRDGMVDYLLYGFVNQKETKIMSYFIGDLEVFRSNEPQPICIKWNDPPDSQLAAFALKSLPESFVLKKWKASFLR